MSRYQTYDQMKKSLVQDLGEDFGTSYFYLWQQVASLNLKWSEYKELFATSPERVVTLNRAASNFFRLLQIILFENILLHLAKLHDPPRMGGNENLSLPCLINFIKEEFQVKVKMLIDESQEKSSFCRVWRNKKIAHSDFPTAISVHGSKIEPTSCEEVESAICAVTEVLKAISLLYFNSEVSFQPLIHSNNANSLIAELEQGYRMEEFLKEHHPNEYIWNF